MKKSIFSVGDFIKTGDELGELTLDYDNETFCLQISLYKNNKQLSPAKWIAW